MKHKLSKQQTLMKFFEDNPDEELTIDDVALKLNCCKSAAYMTLYRVMQISHIESVRVIRLTPEGKRALQEA